jgi:hypothetical protein
MPTISPYFLSDRATFDFGNSGWICASGQYKPFVDPT